MMKEKNNKSNPKVVAQSLYMYYHLIAISSTKTKRNKGKSSILRLFWILLVSTPKKWLIDSIASVIYVCYLYSTVDDLFY